jgi:hypothetical protein
MRTREEGREKIKSQTTVVSKEQLYISAVYVIALFGNIAHVRFSSIGVRISAVFDILHNHSIF